MNKIVLLRKEQMTICDAKKTVYIIQDHVKNHVSLGEILKIFKFSIKSFFSKGTQIYLSTDWLTSSEVVLDGNHDGKYYFLRRVGQ